MKQVELTKGYYAIIDEDDWERVSKHSWSVIGNRTIYAVATINGKLTYLHKFILNLSDDFQGDHRNGNKLDCRKDNLRKATTQQNNCNAPKPQGINGSGYRGVDRRENGRFRASIRVDRTKIALGTYDTAEEAAQAYDAGAIKYHREFALLNFGAVNAN